MHVSVITAESGLSELLGAYCVDRTISRATLRGFTATIGLFHQFAAQHEKLKALADPPFVYIFTRRMLLDFRNWLRDTPDWRQEYRPPAMREPRKASTVNARVRDILALWRYAVDSEYLPVSRSPHRSKVFRLSEEESTPIAWSFDEVREIISHADAAPTANGWTHEHWRVLVALCYYTGGRIGAILGCLVSDLAGDTLTLRAELDKERKTHVKRLPDSFARRLAALPRTDNRLISTPFNVDTLRRHLKIILRAAGLPEDSSFHKFRKASATQVAKMRGKDAASSHLDHSSGAITALYIDKSQLEADEFLDALGDPLG